MNHNPGYEKIGVPTNGPYKGPYTVPTRSLQMPFAGSRPHKNYMRGSCVSFPIHVMLMSLRSAPPPLPLQFMQCWCAGLAAGSFGAREVAHMLQLNIAWMGRGGWRVQRLWLINKRKRNTHHDTRNKTLLFYFPALERKPVPENNSPDLHQPTFLHGNVYMHASLCLYARIVILVWVYVGGSV